MIGILGLDHHWAPAAVRERLSFVGPALTEALLTLKQSAAITEAVILSTCNRTEIYVATPDWPQARQAVEALLTGRYLAGAPAQRFSLDARPADQTQPSLSGYCYASSGLETARHLFRVAAGLRSMQVGESQILGQVKEAFVAASRVGTVGEELHGVFTAALKLGKRVRAETGIARADVSISTAAVALARDALGGLKGRSALLIGAGRTNHLCARLLHAQGVSRLILANRTPEHAQQLAHDLGAETIALGQVAQVMSQVHLIISATAAPHLILSAATVAEGCKQRRAPLVILDLAIPRDVEEAAGLLPAVSLYNIDALRDYGDVTAHSADLDRINEAVEEAVAEFNRWQQVRRVAPAIAALRRHVDSSQETELARALAQLGHLDEADREVVRQFGQRMVDKMFHHLVSRVREVAATGPTDAVLDLLMQLFLVSSERTADSSAAAEAPAEARLSKPRHPPVE